MENQHLLQIRTSNKAEANDFCTSSPNLPYNSYIGTEIPNISCILPTYAEYICVLTHFLLSDLSICHIDGLMPERRNSIANALELRPPCTNPSICHCSYMMVYMVWLFLFWWWHTVRHIACCLWSVPWYWRQKQCDTATLDYPGSK